MDVAEDTGGLTEMLRLSGEKRQVPVIAEGGRVTIGYGGS